ncbi:F-type H+-transporting ATPase subunit b [Breznakia sp. PF5-3]|uniref:F0F1 ATP synthase subunit B n=1 Tax=unclassified Breznakia TaxID=2623764 RepID=UPI0024073827|nr:MULTISPECIES: F0F1 ATP synthase subunit B [unclassified Breznakia]MDL2276670.1 F0F1 ATP synthase subunit B [Breznakia sp. OttesenSCG-928-G09]MDF9825721.1 F-type H+-transporting ATPase subunit b [Breznakia sp. PM6-1]MDF9836551.1 F-type H+-transporting ATPase subunit b [Breznakia sp. PF5-3]MDF9838338.1 F-type H+-transporting ATPase subunit b [Breznakia sp. PFB2-8]MDF9860370.1 F-type H+-transporting ATPase subunit b [Breznakia sp. PH5-24]
MNINIDNYLRIDLMDMGLVLISTFLIVVIARKFFWKYAKEYLDGRQQHIQEELDTSTKNLQESEILKVQYEEKLAGARDEANEIVSGAKKKASQEAGEIVAEARNNAQIMKEKAFHDIEREKANVKEQIKEEISEVAFLAAKKVVEKELDDDVHKKYVKDFIDQAKEDDKWQA